jgi:hypothetical protein
MNKPEQKIILAFLLALKDLKEQDYSSDDEKAALKALAHQLQFNKEWDFIHKSIKNILEVNNTCKELYQKNIFKINLINFEDILSYVPTFKELEQEVKKELSKETYEEVRGYFEIEPDSESDEILNVTIVILTVYDPIATAKKLSFLKRIENFINKIKPSL